MSGAKVFLVVEADDGNYKAIEAALSPAFPGCQIFRARDGVEADFKMSNATPDLLISDLELNKKMTGQKLIELVLENKKLKNMKILITAGAPEEEFCVNEVINGRIQFLPRPLEMAALVKAAQKAAGGDKDSKGPEFRLRQVKAGEFLFREGDKAECTFLLKAGKLRALQRKDSQEKTLGEIHPGEFVGEMACISGEPRSADVQALVDSDLIEIPLHALDTLIFTKPTWAKALMKTLSNRLKSANKD